MSNDTNLRLQQPELDLLFNNARTYNGWLDKPVDDVLLSEIYDLTKMAPTSMNCSPLRLVFVKTDEAKERLKPALMDGNVEKSMSAPVIAILASDTEFYKRMPFLFPHMDDAQSMFENSESFAKNTEKRNVVLQGGYFILAARSVGLDCGPMSGFSQKKVNESFFPDGRFKANFLCNLGYGDVESLHPRSPRFSFDDVCEIV